MRKRKEILLDVISFNGNLSELKKELSLYPWDCETPIVKINNNDLINILKRTLNKKLTFDELIQWANLIECRDDIEFQKEELQELIFEIATPEINGMVTNKVLQEYINRLGEKIP